MMTPTDIAEYGERHVEAWLTSTGYRCHATRPHQGACDIEAQGEEDNLFVHVVAALAPTVPPDLTGSALGRVLSRAMTLGCDAWLAKVQLDGQGDLAADIQWSQLNH